ncbi:sulfatase [Rhodopirellula sp. SWK7]|uniref:sulfatase family protein n=1 Tax=Rhodopirellula sp. SWK7 TaxID=595460 RepID=UPI0002C03B29|nr:sulfatase [Rhodopirellula sp. SWK7]EMI46889.1 arylsulfatase A [Rhodopirellula sp. SWK7]
MFAPTVMKNLCFLPFVFLALLLSITGGSPESVADEKPNVVWIISDDLCPELGCYGYPDVQTPNIDRLASEGTRYTRAFATAPVCSASRTAFQTGQYQTTVGGHHHDTRDYPVLTEDTPTVTGLMQDAGYFVCNGRGKKSELKLAKSHLNFVYDPRTFFDGVDWSQRAEGQPFFAQVQIKEPHREFVQSTRSYPNAPIPPNYPDHAVTRADWANYLASIEVLDQKVGDILSRLDEEGVADNTIVIFFGDHGRPHVRGKQWLYDGGLHVPLIIRWPGKVEAGVVDDRLASLLDVMPTTLTAAEVPVPQLPGLNLLDRESTGHERLFAARDRCGDAPDRIRSVRTSDFKYIRNFHPDRPYMQLSSYKKLMYPMETVMKVLHARGVWDSPFMATTRPKEELYDLKADPFEMHNLADSPEYAERLNELRNAVDSWVEETGDKGRIDESETVDMEALMAEKRKWYARTMEKRGLDPDTSDEEYLKWWEEQLGVRSADQ